MWRSGAAFAPCDALVQPAEHHVFECRALRQQMERLEDEAEPRGPERGTLAVAEVGGVESDLVGGVHPQTREFEFRVPRDRMERVRTDVARRPLNHLVGHAREGIGPGSRARGARFVDRDQAGWASDSIAVM